MLQTLHHEAKLTRAKWNHQTDYRKRFSWGQGCKYELIPSILRIINSWIHCRWDDVCHESLQTKFGTPLSPQVPYQDIVCSTALRIPWVEWANSLVQRSSPLRFSRKNHLKSRVEIETFRSSSHCLGKITQTKLTNTTKQVKSHLQHSRLSN